MLLVDPVPDELDPIALSRFWKSVVKLLLPEDPVDDELVVDVPSVPDVSDCARLSIADARPPP